MSATDRPRWQTMVAPYVGANVVHSITQLVTTEALLFTAFFATYWSLNNAPWLALITVPLSSGLMIRSFIIMHDCAHGSFLPWRRANEIIGVVTGVIEMFPFDQWRRDHAIHHASSGDLDRRGHGDVTTLTVREYWARTPGQRFKYRLTRNPFWLLTGGPFYLFYSLRFRPRSKATGDRQINSVLWTNVALIAVSALLVWAWGWLALLTWWLGYYFSAVVGVWLFYVQHQFEDAYWEQHDDWDYETSAIRGSSYLKLPGILMWFTGNIGLHHVHHLAPRIPNYRLQKCHDENPPLQQAPVLTLRTGIAALGLALWDEEKRRLVRFREVHGRRTKKQIADC